MAGSRVMDAYEAARASVRSLGNGVWYGARPGRDGQYRMGKYTFGNAGRSGAAFSPSYRRAVGNNDS